MRLITRKVWRAFPELDRFSDEQCRRFVKSARGSAMRRLFGWLLSAAFMLIVLLLVAVGVLFLEEYSSTVERLHDQSHVGFIGAVYGLLVLFVGWLTFLQRDWRLRRRIGRVIRMRGTCQECGYSFLGLEPGADLKIRCPECGGLSEVDPSLGELVTDAEGRKVMMHSATLVDPVMLAERAARRRVRRKRIAAMLGAIVLATMVWLGVREYRLRSQAAMARAARVNRDQLGHLVLATQGNPDPELAARGWDDLMGIFEQRESIDRALRIERTLEGKSGSAPDFTPMTFRSADLEKKRKTWLQLDEERAACFEFLARYREEGLVDRMRALPGIKAAVRRVYSQQDEPMVMMLLPELSKARHLCRINVARMTQALEAGDREEYVEAAEEALAISRLIGAQFTMIDKLVGLACRALVVGTVQHHQRDFPDVSWHDAIEAALTRQDWTPDAVAGLEAERMSTIDTIAWLYEDRWKLSERWGNFTSFWGGVPSVSWFAGPGTFAENRDEADAYYAACKAAAAIPIHQRPPLSLPLLTKPMLQILVTAANKYVGACDSSGVRVNGPRVLLALDAWKLRHGEYPATLDELDLPPACLQDGLSGRSLIYKMLDGETDPQGRPFVLYSVGIDGADDGGRGDPEKRWLYAPNGLDLVFNGVEEDD